MECRGYSPAILLIILAMTCAKNKTIKMGPGQAIRPKIHQQQSKLIFCFLLFYWKEITNKKKEKKEIEREWEREIMSRGVILFVRQRCRSLLLLPIELRPTSSSPIQSQPSLPDRHARRLGIHRLNSSLPLSDSDTTANQTIIDPHQFDVVVVSFNSVCDKDACDIVD